MSNQSESIGKLAEALAKAQGKIAGAFKDSANPFYKSKYADLASCWDACRVPLSENGLAVIQTTEIADSGIIVVTTLAHTSGEWIRGHLKMAPVKNDPQGIGSCITYARRYALAGIVGIAQIDDDANAASGKSNLTDPRGEAFKNVSADVAQAAADKIRTYLNATFPEAEIVAYNRALNGDADAYIAASALLSAPERAAWKKLVAHAQEATRKVA